MQQPLPVKSAKNLCRIIPFWHFHYITKINYVKPHAGNYFYMVIGAFATFMYNRYNIYL